MTSVLFASGVVLSALTLVILVLELVVFRFFFKAPDLPEKIFEDRILRYRPNQKGVWRIQDEIAAEFRINEAGWNSGHDRYPTAGPPKGRKRVVLIGDSFVAALQVRYDRSMAEELERLSKGRLEVFRFGMGGAPLSQYLHVYRRVASRHAPDWCVIHVVHNDFAESYRPGSGLFASSFFKLGFKDGKVVEDIPPLEFSYPWNRFLFQSRIWRYLTIRRQKRWPFFPDAAFSRDPDYRQYETRASEQQLADHKVVARYVLGRLKALCDSRHVGLLVVMGGDRQAMVPVRDNPSRKGFKALTRMLEDTAGELEVPFLDLGPVFFQDYLVHKKNIWFEQDGRYSEYGHQTAARAMLETLDQLMERK